MVQIDYPVVDVRALQVIEASSVLEAVLFPRMVEQLACDEFELELYSQLAELFASAVFSWKPWKWAMSSPTSSEPRRIQRQEIFLTGMLLFMAN